MQIEFYYYEDCPSHDVALDRLRKVLAEEGVNESVEIIKVETHEQAQALKFVGSPTIRFDGDDIVPVPEDAYYSLTCRAYQQDDGRITPLPSPEMIRRAIINRSIKVEEKTE